MSSNDQPLSPPTSKKYRIQCSIHNDWYLNPHLADVHFSFGHESSVRIPAHRILLANSSAVFRGIFHGQSEENGSDFPVTDTVSEAIFKEFLQFFYLNEVVMHAESVAGLMQLGHKYKVIACIDACAKYLKETATADNILVAMRLAIGYNHSNLLKFCKKFIMLNTDAVLESTGFSECEQQMLAYIVNENLLACCDMKVFEACMKWVKAKTNEFVLTRKIVDAHLGDLFYEIRFGSMTIQEFSKLAIDYHLVLKNDVQTIIKMIASPDYHPEKFNIRPRQIKWNDSASILTCDRAPLNSSPSHDTTILNYEEEIVFSTNNPVYLVSFMCFDIHAVDKAMNSTPKGVKENGEADNCKSSAAASEDLILPVKIEILEMSALFRTHNANVNVLMTMNAKLRSEITKIALPWPVLIKSGFYYQISITPFLLLYKCKARTMMEEIRLNYNTVVYFHECYARQMSRLISTMEFIENTNMNANTNGNAPNESNSNSSLVSS